MKLFKFCSDSENHWIHVQHLCSTCSTVDYDLILIEWRKTTNPTWNPGKLSIIRNQKKIIKGILYISCQILWWGGRKSKQGVKYLKTPLVKPKTRTKYLKIDCWLRMKTLTTDSPLQHMQTKIPVSCFVRISGSCYPVTGQNSVQSTRFIYNI